MGRCGCPFAGATGWPSFVSVGRNQGKARPRAAFSAGEYDTQRRAPSTARLARAEPRRGGRRSILAGAGGDLWARCRPMPDKGGPAGAPAKTASHKPTIAAEKTGRPWRHLQSPLNPSTAPQSSFAKALPRPNHGKIPSAKQLCRKSSQLQQTQTIFLALKRAFGRLPGRRDAEAFLQKPNGLRCCSRPFCVAENVKLRPSEVQLPGPRRPEGRLPADRIHLAPPRRIDGGNPPSQWVRRTEPGRRHCRRVPSGCRFPRTASLA